MTKPSPAKPQLLSAIDIITLVYCGWILLYMSLGISHAKDAYRHLPTYLGVIMIVLLMAWWHRTLQPGSKAHRILSFVRGLYPVSLFGYFFISSYSVNQIIFHDWLDPFFMGIDYKIFGYYPSLDWGIKFNHWFTSELFHFAYFCYYPMIGGLPLYLYFKKPKAFKELIFNLTFTFYMCYFIFSIIPVIGARYFPEAMEITQTYRAGLFTHIMVFIYRTSTHLGGAFPSSHVAIALVLTVAALRHTKYMGYVFVVISFFLSLGTVYCHYHWFIDAIAGIFAGVGGYYLAIGVHKKLAGAIE